MILSCVFDKTFTFSNEHEIVLTEMGRPRPQSAMAEIVYRFSENQGKRVSKFLYRMIEKTYLGNIYCKPQPTDWGCLLVEAASQVKLEIEGYIFLYSGFSS